MLGPAESFFKELPSTGKVLVLDLGFLGDTIQLMPALHCIREALPQAHLTAMAAEHIKDILHICPWLDAIKGYPRFPNSPGLAWHAGFLKRLRAEKYDVVINLNGSDRSAILTKLAGAPLRLGRVPPRVAWFWPRCFTHTVEIPYEGPLYRQRRECLRLAGFPVLQTEPRFLTEIPAEVAAKAERLADEGHGYIHLSPFATQDSKELREDVLVSLIDSLHEQGHRLVVSCAPNIRERGKLNTLLGKVAVRPWKVFDGSLSLLELAAIIARSRVHLGADSGALHVAVAAGAATVSWWRDYKGAEEWKPYGENHYAFVGFETPEGLEGVDTEKLLRAVELQSSKVPSKLQP